MEDETYRYAELVAWLKEKGHTADEVKKILDRVKKYDDDTKFVSQMDSIDGDDFGLAAIIAEALADSDDES